jgi:hypothetical protein
MMLHHFSSLVLVALCAAERHSLDTDRPLDIFARPDFVDGATYVSTFQLEQSTAMEILGSESDVEWRLEGDNPGRFLPFRKEEKR